MTEVPCSAVELATRAGVYRRGHDLRRAGWIHLPRASPGGGALGAPPAAEPRGGAAGDHRGGRATAQGAAVPRPHGRRGDAPPRAVTAVLLRLLQVPPRAGAADRRPRAGRDAERREPLVR